MTIIKIESHPETLMMSYGYAPGLSEGSLKPPIFLTSTFVFENAQQGKDFHDLTSGRRRLRPGEKRSSFQTTTTSLVRRWSNQAMQLGAVPATTGGLLLEQPRGTPALRGGTRVLRLDATKSRGTHRITGVTCLQMTGLFPNYAANRRSGPLWRDVGHAAGQPCDVGSPHGMRRSTRPVFQPSVVPPCVVQ